MLQEIPGATNTKKDIFIVEGTDPMGEIKKLGKIVQEEETTLSLLTLNSHQKTNSWILVLNLQRT